MVVKHCKKKLTKDDHTTKIKKLEFWKKWYLNIEDYKTIVKDVNIRHHLPINGIHP
jgi:hypothetical protein